MSPFQKYEFIKSYILKGKKEFWYFLFLLVLLAETIFSPISNYKLSSFVIKGTVTFFLFATLIVMYRKSIISFGKIGNEFSLILIQLNIFLIFCAATLLYSSNAYFGSLKWINFLLSFYPMLIGYYLFFISFSRKRGLIFLGIIVLIILTSVPVIVFSHPFAYDGIYALSINQWSHVIYGRFTGFFTIIFLLLYFSRTLKLSWRIAVPFFTFIFIINLLTGLRASILAIILIVLALTIYSILKKNYVKANVVFYSLLVSITFFFLFPGINELAEMRTVDLVSYTMGGEVSDGAISARESLYKTSVQIIEDHWFWGVGFGGFRNIVFSYDAFLIKYPHNMFLEFWAEFGLFGLLIVFLFLYTLFKESYKISILIAIGACYPLILSMFSKDIPGQTLFAIFLSIISLPKKIKKEIERDLSQLFEDFQS